MNAQRPFDPLAWAMVIVVVDVLISLLALAFEAYR